MVFTVSYDKFQPDSKYAPTLFQNPLKKFKKLEKCCKKSLVVPIMGHAVVYHGDRKR